MRKLTPDEQKALGKQIRKTFRDWRAWCATPYVEIDIETMDSIHRLEVLLIEFGALKPRKAPHK
jgi:hypothetical protein